MSNQDKSAEPAVDENKLIAERRAKLANIRANRNPFPNDFRRTAMGLADRLGFERSFLGLSAGGDLRHLAVVMSPTPGLVPTVAEGWAEFRSASNLP